MHIGTNPKKLDISLEKDTKLIAIEISDEKPKLIRIKDNFVDTSHNNYDLMCYEDFISNGDESFEPVKLMDEWDSISINYTSGTTGKPKGVVYLHRIFKWITIMEVAKLF